MTIPQALELALQHHHAGRWQEAETIYRQVLAVQPHHAGALHLLGLVAHHTGRHAEAADSIRQALQFDPGNAAAHSNLGQVYYTLGRLDEASAELRQALALQPDLAEAVYNLGLVADLQGRTEEAVAVLRRAVELRPQWPEAHFQLGRMLHRQGQIGAAAQAYGRACELRPDFLEAHNNLGNALKESGQLEEAERVLRHTLNIPPAHPGVYCNLGAVLTEQGRLDEAIAALHHALRLDARHPEIHTNLGLALFEKGEYAEAEAAYGRALELMPTHGNARFNYACLLLLRGDFAGGWPLYEARWDVLLQPLLARFTCPAWDGGEPAGRTVLLHAEQGFGDAIQFIRYAPQAAECGAHILVQAPSLLTPLLGAARGVEEVITTGDPLPQFDFHLPMLSLPMVFQTTPENLPHDVPYLSADATRSAAWKERLGSPTPSRSRVGLVWAGSATHPRRTLRDISFEKLRPLLEAENAEFFSLQLGTATPTDQRVIDHTAHLHDFADTAGLIAQLDLVITVDTAVAHLAGALGKPVWTLLPFVPDWRWGLEREDSPWYPTMRLFRQPTLGDWDSVIRRVSEELRQAITDRSKLLP